MKKLMMRIVSGVAATLSALTFVLVFTLVVINWMTGCESWDREQWGRNHSCVSLWDLVTPARAEARELTQREPSVRERQRDVAERTSPSWETRLRQRDREHAREARRNERQRERDWRRILQTDEED